MEIKSKLRLLKSKIVFEKMEKFKIFLRNGIRTNLRFYHLHIYLLKRSYDFSETFKKKKESERNSHRHFLQIHLLKSFEVKSFDFPVQFNI